MAYNASIPQAGDRFNQSQADILANFQALASFGNGYADLTVLAGAPAFAVGNNGVYSLLNATTTVNELYIHHQTVDAPTDFPMTASKMSNAAIATCDSGWAYNSSGLLMKWGVVNVTANAFATVNVAATSGGPNFARALSVTVSPQANGNAYGDISAFNVGTDGISNTVTGEFRIYGVNSKAGAPVSRATYLVIGV